MKARNIFGLIVRTFGLCVLFYACWYLAFAFALAIRALRDTGHESDMGPYFTTGIPGLIIGLATLRFGRQIVRFCYPVDKDDADA